MESNIFKNPFKRFDDMRFLRRSKDISCIELNPHIYKRLTDSDIAQILNVCDNKLDEYFERINGIIDANLAKRRF